jgi:hypothetical protein
VAQRVAREITGREVRLNDMLILTRVPIFDKNTP